MPKNGKKSEKRKKSWNFEILNFQMNFFGVKSKKGIFLRGLKNSFFDVLLKEKIFLAKIHSCPPDFSTCLFFTPLIGLIKKFAQIDKRHLLDEVAWSRLPFPIDTICSCRSMILLFSRNNLLCDTIHLQTNMKDGYCLYFSKAGRLPHRVDTRLEKYIWKIL